MVKLKHLARKLDVDPHKLRAQLRAAGLKPLFGRWQWASENDPRFLEDMKTYRSFLSKSSGQPS